MELFNTILAIIGISMMGIAVIAGIVYYAKSR